MAKLPGPKSSLEIIKSISIAEISKEANRPLSVAVVGNPELRDEALRALYAGEEDGLLLTSDMPRALPSTPYIETFENMSEEAGFPQQSGVYDFVIDMGGGREGAPEGVLVYSVAELGGWSGMLERILDDHPSLHLSLARHFPVFRRRVTQRVIMATATANAQFSLFTGISAAIPLTAILLPVSSIGDIFVLTKNQALMVLRLAAAHGLPLDYKSRYKEVGPLIANALGWRTVARQFAGMIPLVGIAARGMIAYAGTVTVGRTAQLFYETGEKVTTEQARRIYKEAFESSRETVRGLVSAMRGGKGGGGGDRQPIPALAPKNDTLNLPLEPELPVEEVVNSK